MTSVSRSVAQSLSQSLSHYSVSHSLFSHSLFSHSLSHYSVSHSFRQPRYAVIHSDSSQSGIYISSITSLIHTNISRSLSHLATHSVTLIKSGMLIAIVFKNQCNTCLIMTVHTNRMRRFQLQHMAAKLHLRFRVVQSLDHRRS